MSTEHAPQIFEPTFVRNFRCTGDQCPSNCCHSWTITLDKKTFKGTRKASDSVIKVLSKENFKRMPSEKSNDINYGYIQLDNRGLCPMLDDQGWCEVHKRLGERALSITCQQYPRMPQYFGDRLELSLTLSCPAAAEEILFNPEAMVLSLVEGSESLKSHYKKGGTPARILPHWANMLRDFSFQVLLNQQLSLPERLFVLGITYHQIDAHLENPLKVEAILQRNLGLTENGSMRKSFSTLPELKGHKWNIFSSQMMNFTSGIRREKENLKGLTPSEKRFMQFQLPLMRQMEKALELESGALFDSEQSLKGDSDALRVSEAFDNLLEQSKSVVGPFLTEHPQVLLNFLLYQLYHYQFLLGIERSPIQFFQVIMVDLLVIEAYLAGIAVECGEIDQEIVVGLFSAYAKKRQHNASFVDNLDQCLEQSASDKLAAVFGLLT
ncbi:flagellin lysine-N-methylase [Ferrimonas sp. SCSIO 43195]|uniref:flagellin lysine-N-methylase n=1 Tax=Ferrimonas sp. SCSIO 43195 TaxID=2822844 RepID=UPI002075B887|nr:flagellin lysine-N-methylase [Ferrimonas sp. SCSIO 43195]USD39032.1 flagellin lysine-N-methylase [Ferrimonas sp. SCSIO 43195]